MSGITLEFKQEAVERIIAKAVEDVINDNYGQSPFRVRLREEINRIVQALDVREVVLAEVAKQLPGVVEKVVEAMLTAEVKRRGKAMLGDLLAQMEMGR